MSRSSNLRLLLWNTAYAVLALVVGAVLLVAALAFFWEAPYCGEDSEAVAYARSLSPDRLEKLYRDMEVYSQRNDIPIDGYQVGDERHKIPEAFSDLKVRRIRPREGNIMVEGCFDHYIYLRFHGIGMFAESEEKKIVLNWGEHPPHTGTEVLWAEP